jgi:hypothetical protein
MIGRPVSSLLLCGAVCVLGLATRWAVLDAAQDPPGSVGATLGPRYNAAGELLLPEGFEEWIFVGANLGLEYKENDAPAATNTKPPEALRNFHNVYINPPAWREFRKSGTFPEGTVLVLDVYRAEKGDGKTLVSEGLFPAARTEVAVAVKNSRRPDGAKTNWAYYDFPEGAKTAKAFEDKACYQCHVEHGSVDNVFVQFYPTLDRLVRAKSK